MQTEMTDWTTDRMNGPLAPGDEVIDGDDELDIADEQPLPPPDPFADLDDDALAAKVCTSQAAAEVLAAGALEAERLATEAGETFRREPSNATHINSVVLLQLAHNAKKQACDAKAEASSRGAEHARRAQLRRVAELAPLADRTALLATAHDRIVSLIRTLLGEVASEGQRFAAELDVRNLAAAELMQLRRELGMDTGAADDTRLTFVAALDALGRGLMRDFGAPRCIALAGGQVAHEPAPFVLRAGGQALDGSHVVGFTCHAYWNS